MTSTTKTVTTEDAQNLIVELGSKSAVIRHLAAQGMSRGDISRALQIKYQFVRNVLVNDALKKEKNKKS